MRRIERQEVSDDEAQASIQRYSSEFKCEALLRASEEGMTDTTGGPEDQAQSALAPPVWTEIQELNSNRAATRAMQRSY